MDPDDNTSKVISAELLDAAPDGSHDVLWAVVTGLALRDS